MIVSERVAYICGFTRIKKTSKIQIYKLFLNYTHVMPRGQDMVTVSQGKCKRK